MPFEAIDGRHYVTFSDKHDLVDKIRHYAKHVDEREEIIKNGRMLFKEEYNFHKHGNYLVDSLKAII